MNKSNFDTISHPLLPIQLCLKFSEEENNLKTIKSKALPLIKQALALALKVFKHLILILADGMEWIEKPQPRFEIFKVYEIPIIAISTVYMQKINALGSILESAYGEDSVQKW